MRLTAAQRVQRDAPRGPIDGPAVVGVHERQRPELVALVDVGHAGDGQLEQRLRQRDALAQLGRARDDAVEPVAERPVVEQPDGERLHRRLVGEVGLDPVRRELALAQRLLEVSSRRSAEIGQAPSSVW